MAGNHSPLARSAGLSRRQFLHAGAGLTGLGLAAATVNPARAAASREPPGNCIMLLLVGSPGHLDTWDPKPDAPADIRGPFRPIATRLPGIAISEHFPRLARLADRLALVRSMYHDGPALHETGQRHALTGDDFEPHAPRPYFGSALSWLGAAGPVPAAVILPGLLGDTGAGPHHGQTAAHLGAAHQPQLPCQASGLAPPPIRRAIEVQREPPAVRRFYGDHPLGRWCLAARRLVECGVRSVTINHFTTVFDGLSWDMHASGPRLGTTFDDYRRTLCPQLDQALSALLVDLEARGLLAQTVVPVVSEMGRGPRINARGGRDHHTGVWTNLLAGGRIRGGRVVGASDRRGAAPAERPVRPAEFLASIYHAMGIDPRHTLIPGADGRQVPLVDAEPIAELF